MKVVVVTYRTSVAEGDRNQALVEDVFDELAREDGGGIGYAAFRLDDGTSFVHVAVIDDPNRNVLQTLPAFAEFQRDLGARCVVPPAPSDATLIGSYGMFGARTHGTTSGHTWHEREGNA